MATNTAVTNSTGMSNSQDVAQTPSHCSQDPSSHPQFPAPHLPSPGIEDISSFPRIFTGVDNTPPTLPNPLTTTTSSSNSSDPLASQREPISPVTLKEAVTDTKALETAVGGSPTDYKDLGSDEWDASKTPPSRFQQRKGSVYATPNSRDSHVDKHSDRDAAYHQLLKDKGWIMKKRRESKGSE